jgi:hypothetical protein
MLQYIVLAVITAAAVGIAIALQFDPKPAVPEGATNAAIDDSSTNPDSLDLSPPDDTQDPFVFPDEKSEGSGQTPEDLLQSPELNQPLNQPEASQTPTAPFTAQTTEPETPSSDQEPAQSVVPFSQTAPPAEAASQVATETTGDNSSATAPAPESSVSESVTESASPSSSGSSPIPGLW